MLLSCGVDSNISYIVLKMTPKSCFVFSTYVIVVDIVYRNTRIRIEVKMKMYMHIWLLLTNITTSNANHSMHH